MDVNLSEEKRVFLDCGLGEISIRQNADGSVSISVEGASFAIALEAENAFTLIKKG